MTYPQKSDTLRAKCQNSNEYDWNDKKVPKCIEKCENVLKCVKMYWNEWKCTELYWNIFKCTEMYSNVSKARFAHYVVNWDFLDVFIKEKCPNLSM